MTLGKLSICQLEAMLYVLDKILTNFANLYCQPQILSPIGSSDHNCILWSPKSASVKRNNKTMTRVIRPMRASDIQRFGDWISNDDWAEVLTDDNTQSACGTFYERVTSHMNRCFPLKKVNIHVRDKPWITPHLESLIKKRQDAFAQGNIMPSGEYFEIKSRRKSRS